MKVTEEFLNDIIESEHIKAVCIIDSDGHIINYQDRMSLENRLEVMIQSIAIQSAVSSLGSKLDLGDSHQLMLEFSSGTAMIASVGSRYLLLIVAESSANIGLLRTLFNKSLQDLTDVMIVQK